MKNVILCKKLNLKQIFLGLMTLFFFSIEAQALSLIELNNSTLPIHDHSEVSVQVDQAREGYGIQIPRAFKEYNGTGIDIQATLRKWEQKTRSHPQYGPREVNGEKLYPVRIIRHDSANTGTRSGTIAYVPLARLTDSDVSFRTVRGASQLQGEAKQQTVHSAGVMDYASLDDYGEGENVSGDEEEGSSDATSTLQNLPVPKTRPDYTPPPRSPLTNQVASRSKQQNEHLHLSGGYKFKVPRNGNLRQFCVGSSQYFNSNGTLGEKGKILRRELTQEPGARSTAMKHLFFRNKFPGMDSLCPKFDSFNDDQKLNFWIWVFASIARTESDCGRNAYNPNDPHGVSIGELQMPDKWKGARDWRGLSNKGNGAGGCWATPPPVRPPSYTYRNPPATYMAQTENNLTCGVEVMAGKLCGFYSSPAGRCKRTTKSLYGHGFWAKLIRHRNSPIMFNIRKFPLCR